VWTTHKVESWEDPVDFRGLLDTAGTWSCRSNGHEIRVEYVLPLKGSGYCGGCRWGSVSAWIDGTKVIDQEDTGEAEAYESSDRSSPILIRLELSSTGFAACRAFGSQYQGDDEWGTVCRRTAVPTGSAEP
jgi:hypothetical protein